MKRVVMAIALAGIVAGPAQALSTGEMVARYCTGMKIEFVNPDKTRTDCISDTHAIEVDNSKDWADGIGQALHYALWTEEFSRNPDSFARWHRQINTPRKPGLVLVCDPRRSIDLCTDHVVRPKRIAEEYGIPLTIWQCDPETDMTLADAHEKVENWRRDYNEVRPHSAIGYNVPIALQIPDGAISPPS